MRTRENKCREKVNYPKEMPSVFAEGCGSGLAHNSASLGFGFSFSVFLWRVLGSAERSDVDLYQDKHTPGSQMGL